MKKAHLEQVLKLSIDFICFLIRVCDETFSSSGTVVTGKGLMGSNLNSAPVPVWINLFRTYVSRTEHSFPDEALSA